MFSLFGNRVASASLCFNRFKGWNRGICSAFIALLLAFSVSVQGQNNYKSLDDVKKNAEKLFSARDYVKATPLFSQLLSNYPKDPNYNYKYGVCVLYTNRDRSRCIKYLEFASRNVKMDNDVYYYLGKAYHLNLRYDDAVAAFTKYKEKARSGDVEKRGVDAEIQACTNAKNHVGGSVNETVVSKQEIPLNSFTAAYDLSPMGGKLLIKPEIYKMKGDKVDKDPGTIYLNKSLNVIYFSSYGADGSNGKDIYKVTRNAKGEWGTPVNMGAPINTSSDEDYPFISSDGLTLYFSSKGHNSIGGYDVFKSSYDTKTKTWGEPVNIGSPVNSPGDELFFVVDSVGNAFYASNKESSPGNIGFYKMVISDKPLDKTIVKGRLTTDNNGEAKDATISVLNYEDGSLVQVVKVDGKSGDYELDLKPGKGYVIIVDKPGYLPHAENVYVPDQYVAHTLGEQINLSNKDSLEKMNITNYFSLLEDNTDYTMAVKTEELGSSFSKQGNYKNKLKPIDVAGTVLYVVPATNDISMQASRVGATAISTNNPPDNNLIDTNARISQVDTNANTVVVNNSNANSNNNVNNNTADTSTNVTAKTTNSQIVDMAYDDARNTQNEARDMKKNAVIAKKIADQRDSAADKADKDVAQLKTQYHNEQNAIVKEQLSEKITQKQNESAQKRQEANVARVLAKEYSDDGDKLQNDADNAYAAARALDNSASSSSSDNNYVAKNNGRNGGDTSNNAQGTNGSQVLVYQAAARLGDQSREKQREADSTLMAANALKNQSATLNQQASDTLQKASITPEPEKTRLKNVATNEQQLSRQKQIEADNAIVASKKLKDSADRKQREADIARGLATEIVTAKTGVSTSDVALNNTGVKKDTAGNNSADVVQNNASKDTSNPNENKKINKDKTIDVFDLNANADAIHTQAKSMSDQSKQLYAAARKTNDIKEKRRLNKQAEVMNDSAVYKQKQADSVYVIVEKIKNGTYRNAVASNNNSNNNKDSANGDNVILSNNQRNDTVATADLVNKRDSVKTDVVVVQNKQRKDTVGTSDLNTTKPQIAAVDTKLDIISAQHKGDDLHRQAVDLNNDSQDLFAQAKVTKNQPEKLKIMKQAQDLSDSSVKKQMQADVYYYYVQKLKNNPNNATIALDNGGNKDNNKPSGNGDTTNKSVTPVIVKTNNDTASNNNNTINTNATDKDKLADLYRTQAGALSQQSDSLELQSKKLYSSARKENSPAKKSKLNKQAKDAHSQSVALKAQSDDKLNQANRLVPATASVDTTQNNKKDASSTSSGTVTSNKDTGLIANNNSGVTSSINDTSTKPLLVKNNIVNDDSKLDKNNPDYPKYVRLVSSAKGKQAEIDNANAAAVSFDNEAKDAKKKADAKSALAKKEKDPNKKKKLNKEAGDLNKIALTKQNQADSSYAVAQQASKQSDDQRAEANNLRNKMLASGGNDNSITNNATTPADNTAKNVTPSTANTFSLTNGTAAYSANKPIPYNDKLPNGLLFKVQIGAFKNIVDPKAFLGLQPITYENGPNGWLRYTAGLFQTYESANLAKREIRRIGYKDAFVVAYYNGKRVSAYEAGQIVNGYTPPQQQTYKNVYADEIKVLKTINIYPEKYVPEVEDPNLNAFTTGVKVSPVNNNAIAANNTATNNNTPVNTSIQPSTTLSNLDGLFYTVQVGVYGTQIAPAILNPLKPLNTELTPKGYYRFLSGLYNYFNPADAAKNEIARTIVPDAFVVAYYKGSRIGLLQARELEKTVPVMKFVTGNITDNKITPTTDNTPPVIIPIKPPVKTDTIKATTDIVSTDASTVYFKVQLGAFREKVPFDVVDKFLELSNKRITHIMDADGLTCYFAGELKDFNEALKLRDEIVAAGIKDAFVVATKGDKKIPVEQAKKLLK